MCAIIKHCGCQWHHPCVNRALSQQSNTKNIYDGSVPFRSANEPVCPDTGPWPGVETGVGPQLHWPHWPIGCFLSLSVFTWSFRGIVVGYKTTHTCCFFPEGRLLLIKCTWIDAATLHTAEGTGTIILYICAASCFYKFNFDPVIGKPIHDSEIENWSILDQFSISNFNLKNPPNIGTSKWNTTTVIIISDTCSAFFSVRKGCDWRQKIWTWEKREQPRWSCNI